MNTLSKRLLILPLLLLLLVLVSSCGSQLVVKDADPATKDAPASAKLDKATLAIPVTEQTSTKGSATKETTAEGISPEETSAVETLPEETATKETTTASSSKEISKQATPDKEPSSKETSEKVKSSEQSPTPQSTVTISIIGDEKKGVVLEPTSIDWQDGDSVLDVLKQVTKSNKIPLEYKGRGMLSYVEGIANLYEFDQGPSSGWLFKVNGKLASKSAGAVKLSKGDNVEWIYSIELSEEPVE
jgi:hypothetical protein